MGKEENCKETCGIGEFVNTIVLYRKNLLIL